MTNGYWNHQHQAHRRIVRDVHCAVVKRSMSDVVTGSCSCLATVCRRVGLDPDEQEGFEHVAAWADPAGREVPRRRRGARPASAHRQLRDGQLRGHAAPPPLEPPGEAARAGGTQWATHRRQPANKSLWDWMLSALAVHLSRVVGACTGDADIGVVTRPPRESSFGNLWLRSVRLQSRR